MRSFLLAFALLGAACGGDSKNTPVDAAVQIDAPAVTLDCPTYCNKLATACTGANLQYGGADGAAQTATCLATCAKFPVGTAADKMGNTLGCRIYHADNAVATSMPNVHCNHAGPGGGLVAPVAGGGTPDTHCSDACTNFCSLSVAICGTGANAATQFTDMASCMTTCATWDRTAPYSAMTPVAGNNLACRMYHITAAAVAPGTHCQHTGPTPAAVCK